MSDSKENKPKDDTPANWEQRIERYGHFGRSWLPIASAFAAFKFGYNFTSGDAKKRKEVKRVGLSHFRYLIGQSRKALSNPPVWESIEEMESGWGIDDSNRHRRIREYQIIRIVYFVVTMLTITYLITASTGSFLELVMIVSLLVTLSFLLLQLATFSWRIHCLKKQVCPNFIKYLKGG